MLKTALLYLIIFPGLLSAGQEDAPSPSIFSDVLEYDFGEINNQQSLSHLFQIENRGKNVLVVEKVEADRNCLIPELILDQAVEPGESIDLLVRFNPARLAGKQKRTISVFSNDPKTPVLTLHLLAEIRIDYRFAKPFLFFKEIDYDARPCESVELESFLNHPLEVTNMVPSHDFFKASFRHDADSDRYYIDIEVDGRLYPPGENRVAAKLLFETNSTLQPTGNLTLLFSRADDLVPEHSELVAADLAMDEVHAAEIGLKNRTGKSFEITGVRFTNDLLKIESWSRKDDTVKINYRIDERIEYDTLEGRFEISLDLDQPSKIAVPFRGTLSHKTVKEQSLKSKRVEEARESRKIRKAEEHQKALEKVDLTTAPLIQVDKETHDFGRIQQGDEVEATFVVSNTGHGDLLIKNVQSGCGCATVTDLKDKIIPPGGSEDLVVRLSTRNKALNLSKSVKIFSNDPVTQLKRVVVKAYIHVDYLLKGPILKYSDFQQGSADTKKIFVESFMEAPLEITGFTCDKPFIHCSYDPDQGSKEPKPYISVTVDSAGHDLGKKTVYGKITFQTNSTQLPEGSFTLIIEPIEDIKYSPRKVFLYRYSQAAREEVEVLLQNVRGEPINIVGIDTDLECVDAEVISQNGPEALLVMRLNEKAVDGRHRSTATIRFDLAGEETLEIPVTVLLIP